MMIGMIEDASGERSPHHIIRFFNWGKHSAHLHTIDLIPHYSSFNLFLPFYDLIFTIFHLEQSPFDFFASCMLMLVAPLVAAFIWRPHSL